jgi:Txe/YoeB family toxin of toxin-antitoxin system
LVNWKIVFTRQAQKDARKLSAAGLKPKAEQLLQVLQTGPFQDPPPFEKLVGDLTGAYSRRINIQHRLVYQILKKERVVKVIRMWTHYE